MSWLMPSAMLPIAAAALVIIWPRLRQQPSNVRLTIEAFVTTLLTIGAFWAGWTVLWWIEQRC
jgi:hypothetical protein